MAPQEILLILFIGVLGYGLMISDYFFTATMATALMFSMWRRKVSRMARTPSARRQHAVREDFDGLSGDSADADFSNIAGVVTSGREVRNMNLTGPDLSDQRVLDDLEIPAVIRRGRMADKS